MPSPTHEFTLLSIHDRQPLSCRLYQPRSPPPTPDSSAQIAILAHPYAPLGGCQDDPILLALAEEFLSQSWTVVTFNFRGAGWEGKKSGGKTSWSGKAEIKDMESVIGFTGTYMKGKGSLLVGGYSYGSLIVEHLPALNIIMDQFRYTEKGSAAATIAEMAQALANQKGHHHRKSLDIQQQQQQQSNNHDVQTQLPPPYPPAVTLRPAFLLISPLLPPLTTSLATSLHHHNINTLHNYPVLAIFGDKDFFTSGKRLQHWSQEMQNDSKNNKFEYEVVEGSGHFWREDGALERLIEKVKSWTRGILEMK